MKKLPNKIYVTPHFDRRYFSKEIDDVSVEYIQMNSFIEKAENYLRNKCQRFILTEKDIDDFVKYMKGE